MSSAPTAGSLGSAAKEKYIEDLSTYSNIQLLEMRDRQSHLLANK